MSRFVRTLIGTSCLLLATAPAPADSCTVRVAQDGSGDCETIQQCIDATHAGCTILVEPGTYAEELFVPDRRILRSVAGPAATTITSSGAGGPLIEIHGPASARGSEISGFTLSADGDGLLAGASVTLRDASLTAAGRGIAVEPGSSGPPPRVTVSRATIDASSVGIVLAAGRARVERTTIRAGGGDGITVGAEARLDLIGSIVDGSPGAGVGVEGSAALSFVTITGCAVGVARRGVAAAVRIEDSIVWGNGAELEGVDCAAVVRSDTDPACCTGANLCVDPAFVDPGAGDYRLAPGSPVIDAARSPDLYEGTPCVDRDGRRRLLDADGSGIAEADMGAYEFDDYAENRAPLEVTGVHFPERDVLVWDRNFFVDWYEVYRGLLSQASFAPAQECADSTPGPASVLPEIPPAGDGFFYLVRSVGHDPPPNTEGLGTCAERSNAESICTTQ